MFERHKWTIGLATSAGLIGLAATSGVVMIASRLVEEFSHPHTILSIEDFSWDMPPAQPEPPRNFRRSLLIQTRDGKLLGGEFWAQPKPASTVVICHGYRVPRAHLRPVAALEYQSGYNVLTFDFRGHGDSDSVITSGGYIEVLDLEAAITAATMQPETLPNQIILHGFSMGAAVALLAPSHPAIAAIIADSPYASTGDVIQHIINYRFAEETASWKPFFRWTRTVFPIVSWAVVRMCNLLFRLRFGHPFIAHPVRSFNRLKKLAKVAQQPRHIPILLIHASGDQLIPIAHARRIVAAAERNGIHVETYFVEHPAHCGAYSYDPKRYTAKLRAFVAKHVQERFSSAEG